MIMHRKLSELKVGDTFVLSEEAYKLMPTVYVKEKDCVREWYTEKKVNLGHERMVVRTASFEIAPYKYEQHDGVEVNIETIEDACPDLGLPEAGDDIII